MKLRTRHDNNFKLKLNKHDSEENASHLEFDSLSDMLCLFMEKVGGVGEGGGCYALRGERG